MLFLIACLIREGNYSVFRPCIRIIGNIVTRVSSFRKHVSIKIHCTLTETKKFM